MNKRENFEAVLAALGKSIGREFALDESGVAFIPLGDVSAVVRYREAVDHVIVYAFVGYLPEDGTAEERARALLRFNDCWEVTNGFTLGLDRDSRALYAFDLVDAAEFFGPEALADCLDRLAGAVETVRERIAADFPIAEEDNAALADLIEAIDVFTTADEEKEVAE